MSDREKETTTPTTELTYEKGYNDGMTFMLQVISKRLGQKAAKKVLMEAVKVAKSLEKAQDAEKAPLVQTEGPRLVEGK